HPSRVRVGTAPRACGRAPRRAARAAPAPPRRRREPRRAAARALPGLFRLARRGFQRSAGPHQRRPRTASTTILPTPGAEGQAPAVIRAWCYTESGEQRIDVEPAKIREVSEDPGSLLWVDVENPTKEEIDQVAGALDIHAITAEDLLEAGQRTKLERVGHH